jgi:CMP-N-acetylneuraminic acid synthetase
LFTVNKSQERFYDSNAKALNHDPENLLRTQDLEPWYQENSNLYLFTKESFSQTNARIGSKPMMLETPSYESTDIDTPDDWDLGEVMIEYYKKKGVIQ